MGNEAKSLVPNLSADSVSKNNAVSNFPHTDREFFSSQSFREIITRGVKNVAPLPDEGGSLLDPRLLAATEEYKINLVEVVLPDSDFNEFQVAADACATQVDVGKSVEELTKRKGYKIERGAIFSRFDDGLKDIPGGSRPYEEAGVIVLWQNPDILNKQTGTQILNSVFGVESLNIPTEGKNDEVVDLTVYGEDGSQRTINMLIVKRQGNLTAGEQSVPVKVSQGTTVDNQSQADQRTDSNINFQWASVNFDPSKI
ncbi:MAG: hypothetical protein UU73_C0001G0343 [Candidatus Daviesbacteria bacterium GW2011_GWA1_41_61]|uniref:Uncharacterized protein n=1 Tax=Candidatus Daviesbacteria bacterium GW2011_GWA2_40_9 TaxID=1618424 RepID=A0A0G0WDW7_9BACT|nr:MAG: hypothetical protein UU26_C0016G0012 [Candidatus Daviesbacteria bacterium GW2011_GWC1_40_9]KKR82480.1 MAG: hypothetical protein UU29_C0012G0018 [Candidatus Daviesbacteria bacterium GW2011_GWA2_40_9]KKR93162.1 MAG: hypothetical protein UU44_C0004G0344 [Candidatus Daviesbacteria bacterium GW2011_GWB1_41_15]KKS15706.1 MAG: hypothetical protein UU73_C0001G0343 [Candidatus Daviesbacteria bacterium GW2011_GWA1_41_61]